MTTSAHRWELRRRNHKCLVVLTAVVFGMAGLAYASVPLYRIFCQVTGYGGTTQQAASVPGVEVERIITVRFDSNVSPTLPWHFAPAQPLVEVKVGESGLAFFTARNLSDTSITGTAVFNVTPLKVGKYFNKIDCFCFTEQILAPGQEMDMPVSFFVDPTIMNDINMGEIKTITLSYTFLRAESEEEKNAALWKNSYEDPVGWMAALSGGLPAPDKFAMES